MYYIYAHIIVDTHEMAALSVKFDLCFWQFLNPSYGTQDVQKYVFSIFTNKLSSLI